MATTLELPKDQLIQHALKQMKSSLGDNTWTDRQKLALTCRILFEAGHDSGLAGQITSRGPEAGTYYTQQLGLGFDEISAGNLLLVDEDLNVLHGHGMANPANRFHSWVYRARPDVNCIIHTHPLHIAALSTLEVPLQVSHMDLCPLYDDCAFLKDWPGVPVGNEEGEIISAALGDKRAILLSHHGLLATGASIEEACVIAVLLERAAKMQLLAMAAGEIKPIPPALAREAHDWISTPKRHGAAFNYYARRCLPRNSDCLAERPFPPGPSWHFPLNVTGTSNVRIHPRHHRLHHHPFAADGGLDLPALGRSIERLIDGGVHAIAPLGSTGEGAYLSDPEWDEVVDFTLKTVAHRVPTIVSVSDLTTAKTVRRAQFAESLGAEAVMVLPISYWKLNEAEVFQHYRAVGEAIGVPVMLYNNPGTSGIDMSVELILRIVREVDNVTMVKESTGDIQRMHKLRLLGEGRVPFYNGCNPLALEAFVAGAKGWCSAAPNLIPTLNGQALPGGARRRPGEGPRAVLPAVAAARLHPPPGPADHHQGRPGPLRPGGGGAAPSGAGAGYRGLSVSAGVVGRAALITPSAL